MPLSLGVKTSSAPYAAIFFLRSIDMLSGMQIISLRPSTAQHIANPMPVLPLVGSIMTVSLFISPRSIASLSIEEAALSLIELDGLKYSSLRQILSLYFTRGVFPINSKTLLYIILI